MNRALLLLLLLTIPGLVLGQNVVNVTDASISGDVVWTPDNIYVLDGFVFVGDGETLTIEAGTVVKGRAGQAENASALIVARGGKIFAEGTPTHPIIFTAEADDVNDPDDLPLDARGLWGGVIILGKAGLNSTPGESAIEGIPTNEPRGIYGGSDDTDNSGVFRYVSIRHGGTDIGAGNEINGLTMGGVGAGTTIEYVEVYGNADDGFEWFGGTVNTRYLVSAFNDDDAFDYDEGFRGKGQFWFAVQGEDSGNRAGEHDGGTNPEDGLPYAIPVIANVTYIGSGATSGHASNDFALFVADNGGGKYYNSIFHDFAGHALRVEDLASGQDSRARLEAGDLLFENNIFGSFGAGALSPQDFVVANLTETARSNRQTDPQLRSISRTNDGGLDPRPAAGSPALSGARDLVDAWFVDTDYVGAFGDELWIAGWTFLSHAGIVPTVVVPQSGGEMPTTITLRQNYPNPFNPSTTIEFQLERAQDVRLAIYDMLGRQVEVLVDGVQAAGQYRLRFDGDGLASGTYMYVLSTEAGTDVRTMALAK